MTNEKIVLHYCGRPINELPREELEEAFAELFNDYTDLEKEVSCRRKEAFTVEDRYKMDTRGPAMAWQPIDTAPKDGTWILVWGGKTDEDDEWNEEKFRFRPVVARWTERNGLWRFASYDCGYYGYLDKSCPPTHWQPLPDHPPLPGDAQP